VASTYKFNSQSCSSLACRPVRDGRRPALLCGVSSLKQAPQHGTGARLLGVAILKAFRVAGHLQRAMPSYAADEAAWPRPRLGGDPVPLQPAPR
jgi:hypothetical protein